MQEDTTRKSVQNFVDRSSLSEKRKVVPAAEEYIHQQSIAYLPILTLVRNNSLPCHKIGF